MKITTDRQAAHTHKVAGKTSTADNDHTHGVDVPDYEARIAALEAKAHTHTDPIPPEPPPTTPAFLSRPPSAPIARSGGSVLIENLSIKGGSVSAPSGQGISISGANGVVIRDVDFADLVGGIYLYQCTGTLLIERVRMRNIGDGTIGSGHSNFIQLNGCRMQGSIRGGKFLGGRTEDMISLYNTGGIGWGQELVVEDNNLEGLLADTPTARAWTSSSGTGTIIGDGAGYANNGHTIVRRNTYLNPGQVGINHIDGEALQTYENVIYGAQNPRSNNALVSWAGNPIGEVHHNRYKWYGPTGQEVGPYFGYGQINAHDNVNDSTINPTTLKVVL